MDAISALETLKGWTSLIQAISWPLVVVFVLLYFGPQIRAFLQNVRGVKVTAGPGGVGLELAQQQATAAANLGAAEAQRSAAAGSPAEQPQEIARMVTETVRPDTAKRLGSASVLWVDDKPHNNTYERWALEALGIKFAISTSTDDAVEKLRLGRYDLVISDMGRPQDPQAGYTLLAKMRDDLKLKTPFLIYAGSNAPEHDREARHRGASGSTGNPRDLFERVVAILAQG